MSHLLHSHDHAHGLDDEVRASAAGIRAVKVSLVVLGITALAQVVVVLLSGSIALAADTIHNFSDALSAIPLWIAFALGTRSATRRYTYGFGRVEDPAGLFVVAMIALSAIVAGYEAIQRLVHPRPVEHLGWVAWRACWASSATNGSPCTAFASGDGSARPPWSPTACMPAPTASPRWPSSSAPAVLRWASCLPTPLSAWSSPSPFWPCCALPAEMFRRLMDGVDPGLVETAQATLAARPGVRSVRSVRMRWIGHRLHADAELDIDPDLTLVQAHRIAHGAEHDLIHAVPKLATAVIHAYPAD